MEESGVGDAYSYDDEAGESHAEWGADVPLREDDACSCDLGVPQHVHLGNGVSVVDGTAGERAYGALGGRHGHVHPSRVVVSVSSVVHGVIGWEKRRDALLHDQEGRIKNDDCLFRRSARMRNQTLSQCGAHDRAIKTRLVNSYRPQ